MLYKVKLSSIPTDGVPGRALIHSASVVLWHPPAKRVEGGIEGPFSKKGTKKGKRDKNSIELPCLFSSATKLCCLEKTGVGYHDSYRGH